jgi:hypothetical protein
MICTWSWLTEVHPCARCSRRPARYPSYSLAGDPVAEGFVQNLAHPAGNLTGFTVVRDEHRHKTAGAAQGDRPRGHVAIMLNPDRISSQHLAASAAAAAQKFSVEVATMPDLARGRLNTTMQQSGQLSWGQQTSSAGSPQIQFEAERDSKRSFPLGRRVCELLPKRLDVGVVADSHRFRERMALQNRVHHAVKG